MQSVMIIVFCAIQLYSNCDMSTPEPAPILHHALDTTTLDWGKRPEVSRRTLLGLVAAGAVEAAAGIAQTDEKAGDIMRDNAPTTFHYTRSPEHFDAAKPQIGIIFPGFNGSAGRLERYIGPALWRYSDALTAIYGVDITSPKELARRTDGAIARIFEGKGYERSDVTITSFHNSAGGAIGLPPMAYLAKAGYNVVNTFLDCAPSGVADVKQGIERTMVEFMALADAKNVQGGPLFRAVSEGIGHSVDERNPSILGNLLYGMRHAMPDGRPQQNAVLQKQAIAISRAPETIRQLREYLGGTSFCLFGPEDGRRDRIVDKTASRTGWREQFEPLHTTINDVDIPDGQHGVSYHTRKLYQEHIVATLDASGLPTLEQQRRERAALGPMLRNI